jgi:sulfide dehydrogenase [flavocytochrome c] flavoprotein subunit
MQLGFSNAPMRVRHRPTRRDVLLGASISAALACPSFAQSAPRVAVIGGGFGGAACARELRRLDPTLQVVLIVSDETFTACPFSNEVIAGLRELSEQTYTYAKIAGDGVMVITQPATQVDSQKRLISIADGGVLSYDRLVLAPGIDIRFDVLPGYDESASIRMPHAWTAGTQTTTLRRQLEAMEDGGVVAIVVPAAPLRCPPAPYERASLIAHYLKVRKPHSKVLILDAKDNYSQQKLFERAWKDLYPGMIERIPLSEGGRVTLVNPATNEIVTDFGNYTVDVANVIPPQRAGRIAATAGAVDRTGWCPIDAVTFASKTVPNIHVIGDAAIAGAIPKSASAASAQGKACAAAIVDIFAGKVPNVIRLSGTCFNTVAPGYAFFLKGIYEPKQDQYTEAEVATSPLEATTEVRQREAQQARDWFNAITSDTFG